MNPNSNNLRQYPHVEKNDEIARLEKVVGGPLEGVFREFRGVECDGDDALDVGAVLVVVSVDDFVDRGGVLLLGGGRSGFQLSRHHLCECCLVALSCVLKRQKSCFPIEKDEFCCFRIGGFR